ncbi:hypothetical protein ACLOJK_005948 [Asimina triloba]
MGGPFLQRNNRATAWITKTADPLGQNEKDSRNNPHEQHLEKITEIPLLVYHKLWVVKEERPKFLNSGEIVENRQKGEKRSKQEAERWLTKRERRKKSLREKQTNRENRMSRH